MAFCTSSFPGATRPHLEPAFPLTTPISRFRPPVCSTLARVAGPGDSLASAVGLVPSGRCAGPDEGLGARIVQPPEPTPGPGCRWGEVSDGLGDVGMLVPRSFAPWDSCLDPHNQTPFTKHRAPARVEVRFPGKQLPQGGGAPVLLLLWRPRSPRTPGFVAAERGSAPTPAQPHWSPKGLNLNRGGGGQNPGVLAPPPSILSSGSHCWVQGRQTRPGVRALQARTPSP